MTRVTPVPVAIVGALTDSCKCTSALPQPDVTMTAAEPRSSSKSFKQRQVLNAAAGSPGEFVSQLGTPGKASARLNKHPIFGRSSG